MERQDIYEALGLEMPSETPDTANPDSAVEPTGENEQPVAEAAPEKVSKDAPHPSAAPTPSSQGDDNRAAEMSKEERARQAGLRREREKQAAIADALAQQKAAQDAETQKAVEAALSAERERQKTELDAFFKTAQLRNTVTGKPITSMEEFNAWEQEFGEKQLEQNLLSGKLTQEDLNRAIEQNPVIRQIREQAAKAEQAQKARQKQDFDAVLQKELAEIRKLDPTINSLEDVLELPTGEEFSRLVQQHNLSFPQAFRLANEERIRQTQSMAAQEAAARAYHSKDHLKSIGNRGGEGVVVPKETMQIYHAMMPELTDDQIRQEYAMQHKKLEKKGAY